MKNFKVPLKKILFVFLVFFILFVIVTWNMTNTCNTSTCQLSMVMPKIATLQKNIESEIRNISEERKIEKSEGIDFGYIGKDGSIVIMNGSVDMIVIARPVISENSVSWKCSIYPERLNSFSVVSDCAKMLR